jgi:hypothetical protein
VERVFTTDLSNVNKVLIICVGKSVFVDDYIAQTAMKPFVFYLIPRFSWIIRVLSRSHLPGSALAVQPAVYWLDYTRHFSGGEVAASARVVAPFLHTTCFVFMLSRCRFLAFQSLCCVRSQVTDYICLCYSWCCSLRLWLMLRFWCWYLDLYNSKWKILILLRNKYKSVNMFLLET